MAKINDTSFKNWNDGETIYAGDYKQERNLMQTAINDNDSQIKTHKTQAVDPVSADTTRDKHVSNSDLKKLYDLETAYNSHAHDTRYYTKTELDGYLRGGDTIIKYELFTVVTADNGDGTFTYQDANGNSFSGDITAEGFQRFKLQLGSYVVGENRIEAYVNNDAHYYAGASGGLKEETTTMISFITPQVADTKILFKYYERLGLMGEHAITHQEGGSDVITVSEGMLGTDLANKINNGVRLDNTKGFAVESRTTDPTTPIVGQMWLRSDL